MQRTANEVVRRRAIPFGVVAIAALVATAVVLVRGPVAAAAEGTTSVATTTTAYVTILGRFCSGGGDAFCYMPESLPIAVGTTVTWANETGGSFPHTATICTPVACPGAPANTGTQTFDVSIGAANGSMGSFTFTSAGKYTYYSKVDGYSAMHAKITVVPPPTISSFTPTSGAPGASITITGRNLKLVENVTFNGTRALVVSDAANKMVVTVPPGATSGHISVTTLGGTVMSSMTFTVT